jgi:hypothetical protein
MSADRQPRAKLQWLEWVLALAILGCGLVVAYETITYRYFPQPFFYDTDDTFRDWYSTVIWAHEEGAYDTWLSVYPPLTFAILKFVGIPACYEYAPLSTVRDCDWVGIAVIHLAYVVNAVLASIAYMRIDRKTALPRAFALTVGMPMLFGLERGNVILLCITCVMLGWGPLLRSARLRWLNIGMVVNFKVYMIAAVLVQLVRRRWLWVEASVLAIVFVYLVSFLIFGEGTPKEIVDNLFNFAEGFYSGEASILSFWYPNTFNPLHLVLSDSYAPVTTLIGEDLVIWGTFAIELAMRTGQILALLSLAAAWLRPEAVSPQRLTLMAISFVMITQETSAYTQPIMFFFIFMERWQGWLKPMAIILTYLVSLPGDIMLGNGMWFLQFSYIANGFVLVERGLGIGMFLRPFGLILITSLFAIDTMALVWRDVRRDGWRDRWRFRKDAPILPRVRRPRQPFAAVEAGPGAGA